MKKLFTFLAIYLCSVSFIGAYTFSDSDTYEGAVVTTKGAWCWFADPRATHYENEEGTINKTYIGYIDVHGNIKAMQYDFLTGITSEVLIRSYFQPDDHNNPTFLVLPDERVMIFYSRHTDEACFYYRISQKPGDITTLGAEKKLITSHNTTYPSPFILSDDPNHIYLCWRGINWHPTIAQLNIPDEDDNVDFTWGPYQIVQSTGARPYAKYASNGTDKILMTYTTAHPDNQNPNYVYYNYIDVNTLELKDVKGKVLSTIANGTHSVSATSTYANANPEAVVDNASYRDWVWEVMEGYNGAPVVAMVRINSGKTSHDYYYAKWTGTEWKKTFLANGGGHFHQSAGLEMCYSGGMAIDKNNANVMYCSVPVTGDNGKVYEIVKYTVNANGELENTEQITKNSTKNNIRPYVIPNSKNSDLKLTWMHGDYYDWIVSSTRPLGYPTAIHCDYEHPLGSIDLDGGLLVNEQFDGEVQGTAETDKGVLLSTTTTNAVLSAQSTGAFSIVLSPYIYKGAYKGNILAFGDITYSLDENTVKPVITVGNVKYNSSNLLGNSDVWKTANRGTGGEWYTPTKFEFFNLAITYDNGVLRTYINGLIDQYVEIENLSLNDVSVGGFIGWVEDCRVYDRALNQNEIKSLSEITTTYVLDSSLPAKADIEALEVPRYVYSDIVLKAKTVAGSAVSWTSNNTNVVSNTGLVTLPVSATAVRLIAKIGDLEKTFDVTVMPRNIENNKVLFYEFETDDLYTKDGVNYVADKSGNGNDATVYGSAQIDGTLNMTANTASGFFTNGYAMAPNGIIDDIRSYTFILTVHPVHLNKQPRLYDFGSASSNSLLGRGSALTAGYKYNGGSTVLINSNKQLESGKESKVAFTFDAKTKTTKIYVNGTMTASSTAITREPYELCGVAATKRNYIGRTQWWDSGVAGDNIDYCGTIDDFKLYNIALTEEEINKSEVAITPDIVSSSFSLYPNPVKVNGSVEINCNLNEVQKNNLQVELVNALGEVVRSIKPSTYPVVIDNLTQKGVYLVKITDGIQNVITNKLVVN
ncbi:T9SS C-terminal target domain-containing protein [Dysgonomonas sp. 216]|uniref:BNR-4 repeat-containing protein n=1 Tax=Dysgonomonas sp. 216 TaxID=2302934 RepID=UPI0013D11CF4|nr:BNR-4 repeat-containing protein [Dysgonomonas sp. 216]NDW17343.1 T9SS C-terminal target domain-containing protein [Dysgonomonas sp. 216]